MGIAWTAPLFEIARNISEFETHPNMHNFIYLYNVYNNTNPENF